MVNKNYNLLFIVSSLDLFINSNVSIPCIRSHSYVRFSDSGNNLQDIRKVVINCTHSQVEIGIMKNDPTNKSKT